MTASQSLYAVYVETQGARCPDQTYDWPVLPEFLEQYGRSPLDAAITSVSRKNSQVPEVERRYSATNSALILAHQELLEFVG